ncbi:hypothetical protein, partial [Paenibacillus glufosinatiresistens]|uniref:hypothetical protein n=1 Tax=Paenibacillus glufosinatiresistens TaxID=3070657 RepID=UPI00286E656D
MIYTDPTGQTQAWGDWRGCFAPFGDPVTDPWKGWSGPVGLALNFLILDSINTLRDSDASKSSKILAAA